MKLELFCVGLFIYFKNINFIKTKNNYFINNTLFIVVYKFFQLSMELHDFGSKNWPSQAINSVTLLTKLIEGNLRALSLEYYYCSVAEELIAFVGRKVLQLLFSFI